MEQISRVKTFECINEVYSSSKGLSSLELSSYELSFLSHYFGLSPKEALILAVIILISLDGDDVTLSGIVKHFKLEDIKKFEILEELESLIAKGMIETLSIGNIIANNKGSFIKINSVLMDAILRGKPIPSFAAKCITDSIGLLGEIRELMEKRTKRKITLEQFVERIQELRITCQSLFLIKHLEALNIKVINAFIFLYIIWDTLSGVDAVDVGYITEEIFDDSSERIRYMQSINSKENELIRHDLVKIVDNQFYDIVEISLTDKSLMLAQEAGLKILRRKKKSLNIIEANEISTKKLFFNAKENVQISLLAELLSKSSFEKIQERMASKGHPKGLTVLFHGFPGTGKTESVLQIAKQTNRDVIKLDISQTKSAWYGQSEMIIKRVFDDYRSLVNNSDVTPILLFNEADAIISKRVDVGTSSITNTENTVQNILLEELEKFEGIFIATTNLYQNFDTAFERRFLFKVEFCKPQKQVQFEIWKEMNPILTDFEIEELTKQYDLSGGQINNVIRKCEMFEIAKGQTTTFKVIEEFCEMELLGDRNRQKLGFFTFDKI
ncbi:ATPase family protein [anaerobic digester metagenome]